MSVSCVFAEEKARIRSALVLGSRAREERGVVYLGGDALSIRKNLSLLDSFLAALWCSRHPKEVQKISPREKLLVSWDRTRERKKPSLSISFRSDAFFSPGFPSIARGRELGTRRPSRLRINQFAHAR